MSSFWQYANTSLNLFLLLCIPLWIQKQLSKVVFMLLWTFMLQYCHKINLWYEENCTSYVRCSPRLPSVCSKRQLERCELNFIWGKMRTAAWETASQVALRDFSKEALGEGQYMKFWWRESSMQSSAYFTKGFLLVTRS